MSLPLAGFSKMLLKSNILISSCFSRSADFNESLKGELQNDQKNSEMGEK